MIEQVAQAIWEAESQEKPWNTVNTHTKGLIRDQARAAIGAMRSITPEMAHAAKPYCEDWRARPDIEWASKIMSAMIDTALAH